MTFQLESVYERAQALKLHMRLACLVCGMGLLAPAEVRADNATSIRTHTLPRTSLAALGNPAITEATLAQARRNGLRFTDLPAIGSGLAAISENEFAAITDRGPSSGADDDGEGTQKIFPLPQFAPAIVRFTLVGTEIRIMQTLPLKDGRGRLLTGLRNDPRDAREYESAAAKSPLPHDPSGVDPEAIALLPDGKFLIGEEHAPSLLVVSPDGEVLVRYTPESKPLPGAAYPVKPVLPAVFAQARSNRGFESVAVSGDGRFAYALLQGPLGSEKDKTLRDSRVVRVLKLDVSDPLNATVAAQHLLVMSSASEYSAKQKQHKISFSDAEWVAPDRLLVIERGKGLVRVVLVDLSEASDVSRHKDAGGLQFERAGATLAALGIRPARITEVFSTRGVKEITSDKLEGLALVGPAEIALINDNDFGSGDSGAGERTRLWKVRLPAPVPQATAR